DPLIAAAQPSRSANRRIAIIAAALLFIVVSGAAVKKFYSRGEKVSTDKSIAVLPLENLSGDNANDYFGEGLAGEINSALAKAGLRVVGRSSAVALASKGMSAGEIA